MSTQSLLMAGPELIETDIACTEDSTFRPSDDELRRFVDDGKVSMKADDLVVRVSGGKVLLDRVTFPIPERSLLGVIGPSGAGKSTLLGALTGMRPADSGTVHYDDKDVYRNYAKLRHCIGLVPQQSVLHHSAHRPPRSAVHRRAPLPGRHRGRRAGTPGGRGNPRAGPDPARADPR